MSLSGFGIKVKVVSEELESVHLISLWKGLSKMCAIMPQNIKKNSLRKPSRPGDIFGGGFKFKIKFKINVWNYSYFCFLFKISF